MLTTAGTGMRPEDVLVTVHREWDGTQKALVRLIDLQDIHRFRPAGAPEPLIHAHVLCTRIMEGDIPHDCQRDSVPHRLLLCILRSQSADEAYAEVQRRAERAFRP